MRTQKPILAFLIIILTVACEFEPSSVYKPRISKPGLPPELDVRLNFNTDTINYYWESPLTLYFNPDSLKVNSVKFTIDGKEMDGLRQNDSTFTFRLSLQEMGNHKLKMEIVTGSGTKSIADQLGMEGFLYQSPELIIAYKKVDEEKNILANVTDRGLSIEWQQYDGLDVKKYTITESATQLNYEANGTSYLNTRYIGEENYYYVYVIDSNNAKHLWRRCHVNSRLPVLRTKSVNNKIYLTWNKTPYSNNISEYKIYHQSSRTSYGWQYLATVANTDTSFLLPEYNFGEMVSFYMHCVPKTYTQIQNTSLFTSYLQSVTMGLTGPTFGNNSGIHCDGFYFDSYSSELGETVLYKYSISENSVKKVIKYNMFSRFSPKAKLMSYPVDSVIYLYDTDTWQEIGKANIKKVVNDYYPQVCPIISDNGMCAFYLNGSMYIFDVINKTLISKDPLYPCNGFKISPDGYNLLVNQNTGLTKFKITANGIVKEGSFDRISSYGYGYSDYGYCDNTTIYIYESPYMYVRSLSDLSVLRKMNIGPYFFNIDFCSGKILTAYNASIWNIYDFRTGNLLQTINSGIGAGANNYTLLCNNIIFKTGYMLKLNN